MVVVHHHYIYGRFFHVSSCLFHNLKSLIVSSIFFTDSRTFLDKSSSLFILFERDISSSDAVLIRPTFSLSFSSITFSASASSPTSSPLRTPNFIERSPSPTL